jgi:hypothetical protein
MRARTNVLLVLGRDLVEAAEMERWHATGDLQRSRRLALFFELDGLLNRLAESREHLLVVADLVYGRSAFSTKLP